MSIEPKRQRQILLVEDEEAIAFPLQKILEKRMFSVEWKATGQSGLEAFKKQPSIDIVLLDIMLPDSSGWDILSSMNQFVKETGEGKNVNFIVLSADSRAEKRAKEEAVTFLPKPIEIEELVLKMGGA